MLAEMNNRKMPPARKEPQYDWGALILSTENFFEAFDEAHPPGFLTSYELLKGRDPAGIEVAVAFLEADPWSFRTGYLKVDIIRYLIRLELEPSHCQRLQKVVLASVVGRDRREFRSYCRLARKVDSPELRNQLLALLEDDDSNVRRRARWIIDACTGRWGIAGSRSEDGLCHCNICAYCRGYKK